VYLWLLARQRGAAFRPARTREEVRREIQAMLEQNAIRASRARVGAAPRQSTTAIRGRAEGEPFELGRYTTRAGERRVLYGAVEARQWIVDASADGPGRMYTVQEDLASDQGSGEPQAVVAAYIAEAERLGRIPLAA
jgi:hypothetical protein